MRNDPQIVGPLPLGQWSRSEVLLEAFEQAWRRGPLPNIDDFLVGQGSQQDALLVALVHVDLELRI
jgi:hypothetical protein